MSNIFVGSRVTPQLHYTKMANYFIKIRKDSLRGLRRKQRAFNLKTVSLSGAQNTFAGLHTLVLSYTLAQISCKLLCSDLGIHSL